MCEEENSFRGGHAIETLWKRVQPTGESAAVGNYPSPSCLSNVVQKERDAGEEAAGKMLPFSVVTGDRRSNREPPLESSCKNCDPRKRGDWN